MTSAAGRIVRVWKGYGTQAGVDRYCRELFPKSVLPHLRSIDGFVEVKILIREADGETEVVVATTWESIDSVRAFAGDDYQRAVVEPALRQLLTRFDDRVTHFTVALTIR